MDARYVCTIKYSGVLFKWILVLKSMITNTNTVILFDDDAGMANKRAAVNTQSASRPRPAVSTR